MIFALGVGVSATVDYLIMHLNRTAESLCIKYIMHETLVTLM